MDRIALICTVMMVITFLLVSCAKLPESQPSIEGKLKMEIAECGDVIPLEWGNLVSVSSVTYYPGWVQMWFQDRDGNIHMIPYQIQSNTFNMNYRYLKRQ